MRKVKQSFNKRGYEKRKLHGAGEGIRTWEAIPGHDSCELVHKFCLLNTPVSFACLIAS